jgi:NitT/TauT family transport system substrate-binding protein
MIGALTTAPTGWHIVVLKDSPIKSVKDLAGKNVGITSAGGLTHLYLDAATKAAGVKAQAVPVGAPGLIPSLKGKQVDAASMHSPLPASLIISGEARSIFDVARDMPPHMPDAWVATLEMIEKKPKVVENSMRAVYETVAFLKGNKEKALELLKKHTGEKDPRALEGEYEVLLGMPTSAQIERRWLEAALELADIKLGAGGMPSLEEVYTPQFEAVAAK